MTDAKWAEVLDQVSEKFDVEDHGKYELEDVPEGMVEYIEFESPMGKVRLERTTTPRVESTKATGGSKYGAGSYVEKVYSDTDVVHTFSAFREVDGEWQKFDYSA